MSVPQVSVTSDGVKQAILRKTVKDLPNRPTDSGMKADQLKKFFYSMMTDVTNSTQAELDRVVSEINQAINTMYGELALAENADGGFTGGESASSTEGAALGKNAKTTTGAALGKNAKCESGDSAIDAIQLGAGTNSTPLSMNVYSRQLLDADGNIPLARLTLLLATKGSNGGIASLGDDGRIPTAQLPSYVDDVIEGSYVSATAFNDTNGNAVTIESGKIYIDTTTNVQYRWTGSALWAITSGLQLGETSSTAYRGDRGKLAYEHTSKTNNPHSVTKTQVGLGNCDNTSDISKPISSLTQSALNLKVALSGGQLKDCVTTFSAAGARAALTSGEKLSISLGKLAKWYSDLGNLAWKDSLSKSDVGLSNVANVAQYSASNPPPYPVTTVCGRSGQVSLSKSDVGLSSVANERQYSALNPPPYPVSSVNGDTGAVNIGTETSGTLATASWSNKNLTLSVAQITANTKAVWVEPTEASRDAYNTAGVRATGVSAGQITFTCLSTPSAALSVNIFII